MIEKAGLFLKWTVVFSLVAGLGFLVGTLPLSTVLISRTIPSIYLPQAIRLGIAALIFITLRYLIKLKVPKISLRLFQASLSISLLAFLFSPVLLYMAVQTLPSGMVAIGFLLVPILLGLFAFPDRKGLLIPALLHLVGVGIFFWSVWEEAGFRGEVLPALLFLAGSVLSLVVALWISKRVLWLYSADDIVCWSMLLGVTIHLIFALIAEESWRILNWPKVPLGYLLWSGAIGGIGTYFYRFIGFRTGRWGTLIISLSIPLCSIAVGWSIWAETPVDLLGGAGLIFCVAGIVIGSLKIPVSRWLCHFLGNDSRKGERIDCQLEAFVKGTAEKIAHFQIVNVSVGGLGFLSDAPFQNGEMVLINVRLGAQFSQLSLEGKISHTRPSLNPKLPYMGGIELPDFPGTIQGYLVEFLAKLSLELE